MAADRFKSIRLTSAADHDYELVRQHLEAQVAAVESAGVTITTSNVIAYALRIAADHIAKLKPVEGEG